MKKRKVTTFRNRFRIRLVYVSGHIEEFRGRHGYVPSVRTLF